MWAVSSSAPHLLHTGLLVRSPYPLELLSGAPLWTEMITAPVDRVAWAQVWCHGIRPHIGGDAQVGGRVRGEIQETTTLDTPHKPTQSEHECLVT